MKTQKKIIIIMALAIMLSPFLTKADGGFFPSPNYYVYETEQKAVIFHEKGVETLIISTAFQGNAKDFGWVIPVPNRPDVDKSSDELFTSLANLTAPTGGYYPQEIGFGLTDSVKAPGVDIIETKKVEYYDVTVLKASESNSLVDWLKKNNYQFPEEAAYLFDDYIKNNWYFVAVRIDASNIGSNIEQQLKTGHAVPIKLVFKSKNIVYPMKISGIQKYFKQYPYEMENPFLGINESEQVLIERMPSQYYPYRDNISVLLYIFSDHKKELPKFSTQYASWIKSKEIGRLATDSVGNPWIKTGAKKYYLTKLYGSMSVSEMNYDLFPRNAENNKAVNAGTSDWQKILINILFFIFYLTIFSLLAILSPFGMIFIASTLIQFLSKLKIARIIAWVFQILIFILSVFVGFFWLILGMSEELSIINIYSYSYSYKPYIFIALVVVYLIFIIVMLGTMLFQMVLRKREKELNNSKNIKLKESKKLKINNY
ncbi:MAG: hypothetical protein Athens101410_274 [Parcubacteria group bacterium Athens1014_10]|nr:MAG: hypothetical protein Athens101410_274 [Parcubacteria group bacterium Athens1014_10]TSD04987.1 MAG: hypothetical protein Athens071412_529 [Parcubacteria group bacterium Athens0714_12]